jgi:hypothetical protein
MIPTDGSELVWLGLSGMWGGLIDLIHDPVWTDDE